MKKLIALFAILVAMTSFSFAASNSATATVNAYTPIVVSVTYVNPTPNILVGGSATVTFTGTYTYDIDWVGSFTSDWTETHTGGTWSETYENGGTYIMDLTNAVNGPNTVTATYTVNYDF
ncbi:MAG: hypothetical protein ACPL1A_06780 [Candidatus Kapaibacteriota bacterium]